MTDASDFAEAVERDRQQYNEMLRNRDGGPSDECDECGDEADTVEVMVRGGFIRDLCPDCAAEADEI